MSSDPMMDDALREKLIAHPDVILKDHDLMRALIAGNEREMGDNIVDLRAIAMERLEARLDRLEDTHRSVIAAAYENLAGTNQVHRAVLRMMDPFRFEDFLRDLGSEVAEILRVDSVKLVLETLEDGDDTVVRRLGGVLRIAEPGYIESYLGLGRVSGEPRQVTLRHPGPDEGGIYGDEAGVIKSEACILLDLGEGRLPGMLAMGAKDPDQFSPQQGTDLLAFFGGVFERAMRRWLA